MGEKVIVNVKTFLDGHRPPDRVPRKARSYPTAQKTSHRVAQRQSLSPPAIAKIF
jgi:hypothetical protein